MTDSSARIDHVQASNDIMDALNENVIGQEGITDATIVATAIDALRHATLALVEQQRNANLIAVLSAENSDFFMLMPSRAGDLYGAPYGPMLEEVQRSLGFHEEEAS